MLIWGAGGKLMFREGPGFTESSANSPLSDRTSAIFDVFSTTFLFHCLLGTKGLEFWDVDGKILKGIGWFKL